MNDGFPLNRPRTHEEMSLPQDEAWARGFRETAGISYFHEFPSLETYLGFGPDTGEMFIMSGFHEFDGLEGIYGGELPVDLQPTLPDDPPYLRGVRL